MKIVKALERKLLDLELRTVEVEPLPDVTKADAKRVKAYPVTESRPVDAPRREFGDGLLGRLHRA